MVTAPSWHAGRGRPLGGDRSRSYPVPMTKATGGREPIDVLLLGLEWFGPGSTDSSAQVVRVVAGILRSGSDGGTQLRVRTCELPAAFRATGPALDGGLAACAPRVVLAIAESPLRRFVTPDRAALNLIDSVEPDLVGDLPVDEPVEPDGPDAHFSTLPLKQMVAALRDAGCPAALGTGAGTMLANQVFYQVQHRTAGTGIRSGLVQVPPGERLDPVVMGRGLAASLRGILP